VARAVAVQPASNEMLTQRIESAEMAEIYQLSDTAHWRRWWQQKSPGSESNSNKGTTTGKNKYENGDNQPPVSCGTGGNGEKNVQYKRQVTGCHSWHGRSSTTARAVAA